MKQEEIIEIKKTFKVSISAGSMTFVIVSFYIFAFYLFKIGAPVLMPYIAFLIPTYTIYFLLIKLLKKYF